MRITKNQLRRIIREELEAVDFPVRLDPPDRKPDPTAEQMDYTFYKDGDIAFYLINVPSEMRDEDGIQLKAEVFEKNKLPAHDDYKVFGPSPSVLMDTDDRKEVPAGVSVSARRDRIISADTLAFGDRPELSKRKGPPRYEFGTTREI